MCVTHPIHNGDQCVFPGNGLNEGLATWMKARDTIETSSVSIQGEHDVWDF